MVIVLLIEYSSYGQSSCSLGSSYINRSVFSKFTEREKGGLMYGVFDYFEEAIGVLEIILKSIWL